MSFQYKRRKIDLLISPTSKEPQRLNVNQNDFGEMIDFTLTDESGNPWNIEKGELTSLEVKIRGRKPDGKTFEYRCEFEIKADGKIKTITFDSFLVNQVMTDTPGEVVCELVVELSGDSIAGDKPMRKSSENFLLIVEESPMIGGM